MKVLFSLLFILVSCASMKQKKDFVETTEYQARPELTKSYFNEGQTRLTEEQIKELLSMKQVLPFNVKMAIAKIGHTSTLTNVWSQSFNRNLGPQITDEGEDIFKKMQGKDKRIKSMAVIPQNLMPSSPDLRGLRDIAALMQANLLVVLDTKSRTDSKLHMHKKNEVKATATIEVIVIDVLTGVIAYTSIATQAAHLKEENVFNIEELYQKATIMAEDKAVKEVFTGIDKYFN